jgi:tetratricopeptide (TPR) repeat protein
MAQADLHRSRADSLVAQAQYKIRKGGPNFFSKILADHDVKAEWSEELADLWVQAGSQYKVGHFYKEAAQCQYRAFQCLAQAGSYRDASKCAVDSASSWASNQNIVEYCKVMDEAIQFQRCHAETSNDFASLGRAMRKYADALLVEVEPVSDSTATQYPEYTEKILTLLSQAADLIMSSSPNVMEAHNCATLEANFRFQLHQYTQAAQCYETILARNKIGAGSLHSSASLIASNYLTLTLLLNTCFCHLTQSDPVRAQRLMDSYWPQNLMKHPARIMVDLVIESVREMDGGLLQEALIDYESTNKLTTEQISALRVIQNRWCESSMDPELGQYDAMDTDGLC